jgi:type VI secretion system secreted protein Hcp
MASDIFIAIDTIKGEAGDHKHKDEIQVESWSWGLSQTGSHSHGSGGGAGKVSVHDMTFTHFVDKASCNLIQACAAGTHFKKALLTVRKAGGKEQLEYFKVTMEDLLVSNVNHSGNPHEEKLMESVGLNFSKFKVEYQIQKPDGTGSPGGEAKWDQKANKEF